ncbi:MAG TPA: hypothetical protein VFX86_04670 [Candidatus Saccharimonadales bacterium]|nr:hypothetical protein [Candidatus Saccharimonadales bacterium]
MVNKRKLRYEYKKLKHIKSRYLLIAAFFFLILGIYGLRQNYAEMVRLRTAVSVADEQNGNVEKALRELREFVYNHMNTDLSSGDVSIKPPIQLKYRYERLVRAEEARTKAVNEGVKQTGEEICARKYPASGYNSPRVSCVAEYVRKHSADSSPIPDELYKFDFISPTWSPDLAGISLLLFLIFLSAAVVRTALGYWYRSQLD